MHKNPYATAFQAKSAEPELAGYRAPWAQSSLVAFQKHNQVKNMRASASVYIGTISYSNLKQQRDTLFPEFT